MRKLIIILLTLLTVSAVAKPTTYGPVTKADQLWQIAILVRPSAKVSIQQTMLALYQANPTAFIDGNSNQLRPQAVLQVPTLAEINKIQPADAQKFILSQAARKEDSSLPPQELSQKGTKVNRALVNKLVTTYNNNVQQLGQLQQNYSKIGNILLSMDQQYQVRIADLEQHNLAQQKEIVTLNRHLLLLDRSVAKLQTPNRFVHHVNNLILRISYIATRITGYAIAAIIFFLMWLFSLYRRKVFLSPDKKSARAGESDIEDEYDFMSSAEGVPAKLDLGRAYIDMGDKGTAKEVLQEVLKDGNKAQQQEAKKLLKKCE